MLEKEFIPYRIAVTLKKLGFDEDCFGYYENNKLSSGGPKLIVYYSTAPLSDEQAKRPGLYITNNRNSVLPQWATSAPTFSQAFRWFRNKHNLNGFTFSYGNSWQWKIDLIKISNECFSTVDFKSYEEAELACLKKLIEITKTA